MMSVAVCKENGLNMILTQFDKHVNKFPNCKLLTYSAQLNVLGVDKYNTRMFYCNFDEFFFNRPSGGGTRSARPNNCTIHFSSNGGNDSCVVRSSASIDTASAG